MIETRIATVIRAIGLCLCVPGLSSALAESPTAEDAVPVEHASFHQLVFADDDVAILNNRYPLSGDSGFHAHDRDLFAVIVQPSENSGQTPGKPLTPMPTAQAGTASYSPVVGGRRVHRVVNYDKGPFHIVVVELRRAKPLGTAISSRDAVPQYVQIVDNPRMRAWRLILEPGQSAAAISQSGKGVRIVVRGGLLTTHRAGIADQVLALRPADFSVQLPGSTRALTNSGTETIELVEMELK